MFFLARDFLFVGLFAWAILAVDSWILGFVLSVGLGCAVGGLFTIGHDCGHRSFSKKLWINDLVGHLTTSPVFWPFHMWRIDHDTHHRHTNHIDKDTAWRPITYRLWLRMPKTTRNIYLWTRKRFFFLGSIYTTFVQIKEGLKADSSKKFTDDEKKKIKLSMVVMFSMAFSYMFLSIWAGGLYGFVYLFLIPQLVFHSLLSTFTYFHHTSVDSRFMDKKSWTAEQAQLGCSIYVKYPRIIEMFCHDINWHTPHHVCVGIPHYHLREAHQALKAAYPEIVRESVFSLDSIKEVTSHCHFVVSKNPVDLSWSTADEAVARFAAKRRPKPATAN
jgi:omega-6 fatty acid desaturase (delta-12 desaturase)